jgi:hypothetical protein
MTNETIFFAREEKTMALYVDRNVTVTDASATTIELQMGVNGYSFEKSALLALMSCTNDPGEVILRNIAIRLVLSGVTLDKPIDVIACIEWPPFKLPLGGTFVDRRLAVTNITADAIEVANGPNSYTLAKAELQNIMNGNEDMQITLMWNLAIYLVLSGVRTLDNPVELKTVIERKTFKLPE